ncbi:MAG: ABC transporter ATP-binding protein [Actinobacteria bacterium]|nr:MAG: ABC transporter ATP-binding protein [Actinomycetota bacterium]
MRGSADDAPVMAGSSTIRPADHAPTVTVDTDVAIHVDNVSKCYHIYDKPVDRLKQAMFLHKKNYFTEFWAVKGVSFTVRCGEAVGIIGRNGCGKSTLLQMIAGVLAPTTGRVTTTGRISAMLELGSVLNPNFTGRENVYLQGSVLGITRKQMDEKFDDIAGFADIGAFIDQPLKTYSSGMQARIAFAVNAMIDPDIMIVDEILSVGDIGFQQRCANRLKKLRDNGMTLLYVSHSPDSVRALCQKGLFLVDGKPQFFGASDTAVNAYLKYVREHVNKEMLKDEHHTAGSVDIKTNLPGDLRYGSGHVQIEAVQILDEAGEPRRSFQFGETIRISATIRAFADTDNLSLSFLVRDRTGIDLMGTTSFDERADLPPLRSGDAITVQFAFENQLRRSGFGVSLAVHRVSSRDYSDNILYDQIDGCATFNVMQDPDRPVHYKFNQPVSITWEKYGNA